MMAWRRWRQVSGAMRGGIARILFLVLSLAPLAGARGQDLPISDTAFVQYLLIWTGDYKGMVDGVFGERSRAAAQRYLIRKFGRVPQPVTDDRSRN